MRSINKKSTKNYGLQFDQFRWLADNSSDIIHILDEKGLITYINPAVIKVLGYTQEEMIGKNAFEYVHPDDLQRITQTFTENLKPQEIAKVLEMRIRHKSGNWVSFEVASKSVITQLGEVNLVINSRDITERKKTEQLKEEFLSLVAHELKTPLTVMKLVVQTISYKCRQAHASQSILKSIRDVDTEINRLAKLINAILDISKLESGVLQLEIKQFSLTSLIRETILELRHTGQQRINFAKHSKILVQADRDRIKQALINLLSNSIKYSKKDGVIDIKTELIKDMVIVSVKDEGTGIPKARLPKLFDKFYQVEDTSKLGSGLGLYITKEIIKKHKGEIWVSSKEGKGSTFYFSLPVSNS